MKKSNLIIAALLMAGLAAPAIAGRTTLTPVASDGHAVRYDKGTPTIETDTPTAGVKVVPLRDADHGSQQFMVAVYNKLGSPSANFGVENIHVTREDGSVVEVFTRDRLESKAKSRAMWSQIGMAMLVGAAAASQNNNTYVHTYTPYGAYTSVIERPGLSLGQVATIGAGGAAIALTQVRLEQTLARLGDEIVQTTTVNPDSGYGGRVVIAKMDKLKPGEQVTMTVAFNGQDHVFAFNVDK